MAGRAPVQPDNERWCSCGHARSAHVDYAQRCDDCGCPSYLGSVIAAKDPFGDAPAVLVDERGEPLAICI
jgi:hypothetical protein